MTTISIDFSDQNPVPGIRLVFVPSRRLDGPTLTYDPMVHRYFGIGVNADDVIEWVWSTDGLHWTVHHTLENPWPDAIFERIGGEATNDAPTASGTTVIYDDFITFSGSLNSAPATRLIRVGGEWVPLHGE